MYFACHICQFKPVGVAARFQAGLLACASAFCSPSQVMLPSGYEQNYTLTAAGPRRSFTCFPLSCLSGRPSGAKPLSPVLPGSSDKQNMKPFLLFNYRSVNKYTPSGVSSLTDVVCKTQQFWPHYIHKKVPVSREHSAISDNPDKAFFVIFP
jgi:hypothetical protein